MGVCNELACASVCAVAYASYSGETHNCELGKLYKAKKAPLAEKINIQAGTGGMCGWLAHGGPHQLRWDDWE